MLWSNHTYVKKGKNMQNSNLTRAESAEYLHAYHPQLSQIEWLKALTENAKVGNAQKKSRFIKSVIPFERKGIMVFYKNSDLDKLLQSVSQSDSSTSKRVTSVAELVEKAKLNSSQTAFYGFELGEFFVNPIADTYASVSPDALKVQMLIGSLGSESLLALTLDDAKSLALQLNETIKFLEPKFEPFIQHQPTKVIRI